MREETFTETVERYRMLLQQKPRWTLDEAAQAAAFEGKGVVLMIGILRNVFGVSHREAVDAAAFAIHSLEYGQPVITTTARGKA